MRDKAASRPSTAHLSPSIRRLILATFAKGQGCVAVVRAGFEAPYWSLIAVLCRRVPFPIPFAIGYSMRRRYDGLIWASGAARPALHREARSCECTAARAVLHAFRYRGAGADRMAAGSVGRATLGPPPRWKGIRSIKGLKGAAGAP